MYGSLAQKILAHLGTIAVAAACGLVDPAPALAAIPESLLIDLVDEIETSAVEDESRRRLLGLLGSDSRPAVRARVAGLSVAPRLAASQPREADLRRCAADDSAPVRRSACDGLVELLTRAPPLERVDILERWVTSPTADERRAVAQALANPPAIIGDDAALTLLCADPSPRVRRAAIETLVSRADHNTAWARDVARGLVASGDRYVRRTARKLRRRAAT